MTATASEPASSEATLEAAMDGTAAMLGLAVLPEWRANVLVHLKTLAAAAQAVDAFPGVVDGDAAPVFEA